ncbi:MAG: protein kinase domain-containing protein [Gemmatimonadales bacterium]
MQRSALPPGLAEAFVGRYRIERELGAGGLATVYLADDLRHHRKVALKVLHEDRTALVGAARFLHAIGIAARLQHPNILPLLDSGESRGLLYYVMPYVKGHSLRERLAREGALPVAETIRMLLEIVDALAHAHAHGVVHLDVKPENVLLSGRHALVTDFGIARAVSGGAGRALGTSAYLAPEQASGDQHLDHRADLYAVGVVAHEMLTGRLPGGHPPGTDPALEQIVMKCLAQRPADRWQSAAELLAQLEPVAITPTTLPQPDRGPGRRSSLVVAALVAVAVLVVAAVVLPRNRGPSLTMGRAAQFTAEPGLELYPAISPDGRAVAYAAGNSARMRISVRPLGGGRTLALSNDTIGVETQPRWSPDGERILFLSRGAVYVASSFGGAARRVVARSADAPVVSAAWSPDGREIAVVRGDSLLVFSADGGGGRFVSRGAEWHSCIWSPTRIWIACVAGNLSYVQPGALFGNVSPSAIVVIAASDGRVVSVTDSASSHQSPQWAADGSHLFFVSNRAGLRDIFALSIRSDGRPRGHPVRITTGLGAQSFSVDTAKRRLAYAVYQEKANVWSLPIPAAPPVSIERAVQITSGSQVVETMRVSGDEQWLVYDSDVSGNSDIYRIPADGGEPERLTSDPADDFAPAVSPNGTEIAFHSFRLGTRDIFVQPMAGGRAQTVVATAAQEGSPAWSPDGSALAYADYSGDGGILVVRRDSIGRWGTPVRRLSRGLDHAWSPDGRMIAVASGRTVRGVRNAERLELLPPDSGDAITLYAVADSVTDPVVGETHWSRVGRGLYFKSQDALGRASIWYQSLSGGRPRLFVRFADLSRPSFRGNFGVDSRRFFFAINDRQSAIWVAEVTPR